jgi:hypothetical protein
VAGEGPCITAVPQWLVPSCVLCVLWLAGAHVSTARDVVLMVTRRTHSIRLFDPCVLWLWLVGAHVSIVTVTVTWSGYS